MPDVSHGTRKATIAVIACVAAVFALLWLLLPKPAPSEQPWLAKPFVHLSIDVHGGTKPDYRCNYYFRFGEAPKSLDFTGLSDVSLSVRKVGRRTAALQLITGTKTVNVEVGTPKQEIVLDDERKISLAFLSSTIPPYDDAILLSDSVEVFGHFHLEPIEGGDKVPPGVSKEEMRTRLIGLLRKMLTETHGWEGFDARGDGYEIDVTIDGRPVHISMTFRSGWIVIKDDHDVRYYGFHPDRLKELNVALDQYAAMESAH